MEVRQSWIPFETTLIIPGSKTIVAGVSPSRSGTAGFSTDNISILYSVLLLAIEFVTRQEIGYIPVLALPTWHVTFGKTDPVNLLTTLKLKEGAPE